MARFPRTEPEVASLAQIMVSGLTDNVAVYPAPPVAVVDLMALTATYNGAVNAAMAAAAEAEAATTTKNEALEDLVEAMKTNIRYAENTVNYDDDQLKLIGWAGRATATPLAVPGQVRLLEAPRQGEGWVVLDWKAPSDGGKVAAYRVMRRERPAGSWDSIATAIETEATLVEQPRGKELEYQVIAVNKAGDGPESNMVMVVL